MVNTEVVKNKMKIKVHICTSYSTQIGGLHKEAQFRPADR